MAQKKKSFSIPDWLQWLIISILVIGIGAGAGFWISDSKKKAQELIQVQVFLDNRCELIEDAFMAVSDPDGAWAYFMKGVAVLNTRANSRIVVVASDKYPGFHFESTKVNAAPVVTITTRCGEGDRAERALGAMREQFKGNVR